MNTKPPLSDERIGQWCNDVSRELEQRLEEGGLQYPIVNKKDLKQLTEKKHLARIVHVKEDNCPYVGIVDESTQQTVWKKINLGEGV